jgi:hypothetical protein
LQHTHFNLQEKLQKGILNRERVLKITCVVKCKFDSLLITNVFGSLLNSLAGAVHRAFKRILNKFMAQIKFLHIICISKMTLINVQQQEHLTTLY